MDWLTFISTLAKHLAWPSTILLLIFLLRDKLLLWLQSREVKVTAAGIEILIQRVDKTNLTVTQRKELLALSANEIWALNTFQTMDKLNKTKISALEPAQKVMAVTLIDVGAVEIANDKIQLTSLGEELLEKAKNII